jgi:hypothetical protein
MLARNRSNLPNRLKSITITATIIVTVGAVGAVITAITL